MLSEHLFCEHKNDLDQAMATFCHTHCIGRPRRNIAIPFGTEKLEWCGYPTA